MLSLSQLFGNENKTEYTQELHGVIIGLEVYTALNIIPDLKVFNGKHTWTQNSSLHFKILNLKGNKSVPVLAWVHG